MKDNKLTASAGMVLTNGEAFGTTIYLGVNDDASNWYEITEEEYSQVITEQGGE
jgi:hypothetical protein